MSRSRWASRFSLQGVYIANLTEKGQSNENESQAILIRPVFFDLHGPVARIQIEEGRRDIHTEEAIVNDFLCLYVFRVFAQQLNPLIEALNQLLHFDLIEYSSYIYYNLRWI